MKQSENIDQLMADYENQVKDNGKHTYSENTHNDTGSGCCGTCCDSCSCCMDCSTGSCCW